MRNEIPKLSAREAVARSYPGWDRPMADRLLAWLDHCGYVVVEKDRGYGEATLAPTGAGLAVHPSSAIPAAASARHVP